MNNESHHSPMPIFWRVAMCLCVLIGAAAGFLGAREATEDFNLILSLIFAGAGAGLGGGLVVVLWFILRRGSDDADITED